MGVFDLYNRLKRQFMSRKRLEMLCKGRFAMTQCLGWLKFESKQEIEQMMDRTMSTWELKTPGPIEGLYLKVEDEEKGINVHRCKLVRSDFIQGITEHWIHGQVEINTVRQRFDDEEGGGNDNDGNTDTQNDQNKDNEQDSK